MDNIKPALGMAELSITINEACKTGQVNVLKWIVEQPLIINDLLKLIEALETACYHGQLGVVQFLATETLLRGKRNALSKAMGRACQGLTSLDLQVICCYTIKTITRISMFLLKQSVLDSS